MIIVGALITLMASAFCEVPQLKLDKVGSQTEVVELDYFNLGFGGPYWRPGIGVERRFLGALGITATNLYLFHKKENRQVLSLSELAGAVTISNAAQALAFVRLGSSPESPLVRDRNSMLEVVSIKNLSKANFLGNHYRYDGTKRAWAKYYDWLEFQDGIISETLSQKFHVSRPNVDVKDGEFIVSRFVISGGSRHIVLWSIQERVGKTGEYTLVSKRFLRDIDRNAL